MIPVTYIGTRATGYWDGQNLVDVIAEKYSADRAESLRFRFENENILVEKALQRSFFGWGGWGRSRVYAEDSKEDKSVTDGFWIIALGTRGYFGLFSVTLVLMLPAFLLLIKCPPRLWGKPEYAPTAVISLIPLLFMIDCLLNGMINQVYIIFAGGASGLLAKYGIAGLEDRSAPGTEAATESPISHPGSIQTARMLGVSHSPLPEKGRPAPGADARAMATPLWSRKGAGTRIGWTVMKDESSRPLASYGDIQSSGSVGSDEKMAQSDRPRMRLLSYEGFRRLQEPATITVPPILRGVATPERRAPSESKQGDLRETPRADRAMRQEARDGSRGM